MVKYAKIVFEVEINDDDSSEQIENKLNEHVINYLSDMHNIPIDDIEVSDQPYSNI